jgi:molybdate transport system ATP-binding protein
VLEADVEVDRGEFAVRARIEVAPGERLALFGPSGAGKTTLLEAIAGLVRLRRGRIMLRGRVLTSTFRPVIAVPPWQRRVGLLRQDPGLFPHLTVGQNLSYAPGADPGELAQLAEVLGIGELLAARPARLSGGQAHRVAVGRLLLAHCDTLLLDEPYAGLDAALRRVLTELVAGLVAARSVPSVLVAHELADAQSFADRLAVLDAGQLLQVGAPDQVVLRPASRRVAVLVGYLGFVPVRPGTGPDAWPGPGPGPGTEPGPAPGVRAWADGGLVAAPGDGTSGAADLIAGIHPERVLPGAHPDRGLVLTGTVTAARPAGAGWEADLNAGGATLTCRLPDRPGPAGTQLAVTALAPPLFGPDGAAAGWPAAASGMGQVQT